MRIVSPVRSVKTACIAREARIAGIALMRSVTVVPKAITIILDARSVEIT
jgi:hypothetical protein